MVDVSLSDSDMQRNGLNVLQYDQLSGIGASDLLRMMPITILYQKSPNIGHWTLLHKTSEGVEFYDSYGFKPDKEFEWLEWKQPHYLAKMLYEISKISPIHYNQYNFQSREPGVATCGRWVILRKMFSKYGIDEHYNAVMETSRELGISPDQLVVSIVR